MSKGYVKSLDGIRAMALLLIMTYHAELTHSTWVSVQLFFVLSGYLITGILWKEKFRQDETLGFKFKKFWVRRSLRIFPLYFGYLAILGCTYLIFNFPSYFMDYFGYLITYTVNYSRLIPEWQGNPLFTHLWTLSIEEQFYLVFPLLIFFLSARNIKFVLLAILVLSPVCRYLLGAYYQTNPALSEAVIADTVYWNTLTHLDSFCLGGLIPVFSLEKKIKHPGRIFIGSVLLFFGAGALNYFTSDTTLHYFDDFGYNHWLMGNYQHVWHYTVINLVCATMILVLVSPHTQSRFKILRAIMENNIIVRIGKVSYGMYVFHWIVLVYFFQKLFPFEQYWVRLALFIPYVLAVWGMAELSYRLYEARFLKLKDTLFQSKVSRKTESSLITKPNHPNSLETAIEK